LARCGVDFDMLRFASILSFAVDFRAPVRDGVDGAGMPVRDGVDGVAGERTVELSPLTSPAA
jgi:hypothetical protein